MFCNQCGHRNPPGSNFCSSCGASLNPAEVEDTTMTHVVTPAEEREADEDLKVSPDELEGNAALLVVRKGPNEGSKYILDAEVTRAGRGVGLTPREFELLEAFMRRPRQVLGRDELLAQVWGYDFETDTNVVDVYVLYLRRKLEAAGEPRLLHGAGYALREG